MASCAAEQQDAKHVACPAPHPGAQIRLHAREWRELGRAEAIAGWDVLAHWASEPNPFYESWYLLPSLRALDPHASVKLLCFEVDGTLAGIMPLARSLAYYGYPFPHCGNWAHSNCFFGAPLVAKGCEQAFWRSLFAWCDERAGKSLFLHLTHIPLEGALFDAMRKVAEEDGRAAALVQREERAMLASDLSPDAYFEAALKPKRRGEINRKRRRLAELGELTVTRQCDAAGIEDWTGRFLALERAGWKGKAGSALACEPEKERLFREALAGAAARGRLERLELALDGRPVAMLTTFLVPPGAFGFKTAFDEELARFSPGVLAQHDNLALLGRPEIEWCDSCSAEDHPMIDHFWQERRAIGRVSIAIGGTLRRAAFAIIRALEKGGAL